MCFRKCAVVIIQCLCLTGKMYILTKSIQSDKKCDWRWNSDLTPICSDLFELLHVNVSVVVPVEYLERIPQV